MTYCKQAMLEETVHYLTILYIDFKNGGAKVLVFDKEKTTEAACTHDLYDFRYFFTIFRNTYMISATLDNLVKVYDPYEEKTRYFCIIDEKKWKGDWARISSLARQHKLPTEVHTMDISEIWYDNFACDVVDRILENKRMVTRVNWFTGISISILLSLLFYILTMN